MPRRKVKRYDDPSGEHTITASELKRAGRERQLEIMRHWFHSNYEDPVENTPYESAEGGYIYIWGGPYDPEEELSGEFGGIVPDKLIDELASELRDISWEWTGHPDSGDVDDYLYSSIALFTKHLDAFQNSILDVENLLKTKVAEPFQDVFCRLLYVNVITAFETYLSDLFISTVAADRNLLRKFVETNPDFKAEKISVSEVFKTAEDIERRVRAYLVDIVWHHLARVKPMFKEVLGIGFPDDMGALFKAILIRHDIVHRNGKTKDGASHVITQKEISELIKKTEEFVGHIESQWQNVKSNLSLQGTPEDGAPEF